MIVRPLGLLGLLGPLGLLALASACSGGASPGPFEPFVYGSHDDPTTTRLCANAANPDLDPDPLHPACRLEGEALATEAGGSSRSLRVFAYNLERGYELDGQLAWLAMPGAPRPDVVVLSEADRGCSRTGYRHVAREWAEALGMNFVFAVEFEEVSFDANGVVSEVCEHGDAILSRAPLGNVRQLRFASTDDWNDLPSERTYPAGTRFGGRVAIRAELNVGGTRIRIYGTHLASGAAEDTLRGDEAREILADAEGVTIPVLVVGDMNTHLYKFDLDLQADVESVTQAFFGAGYEDAHASLPMDMRGTELEYFMIIDLILGRGVRFEDPWIGDVGTHGMLSDHLPIAATVRF